MKDEAMQKRRLALVIATALGVSSPVLAQEHKHPSTGTQAPDMAAMHCGGGMAVMMQDMTSGKHAMPGMRSDTMMAGMMDRMHKMGMMDMMGPPGPAMILQHKNELSLSDAQVTRLEALQKEAQPACTRHMQLAMTTHKAANQVLDAAAPNFAAYTAKLKEATGHMAEGHVAMAKAAVAARKVLTATQRQALKNQMKMMHKKP